MVDVMAEDTIETKELVERAKNMDADAFGQLYDMYYENIFKYAFFKTGNAADGEDLASQVFSGALKNIRNFSWNGSSFASWLFRIAHNVVVDHWRKRGQVVIEPIDDHLGLAGGTDVAKTVIGRLQLEKLQAALGQLPDEQSKVVVLRFINGLSAKETAHTMGKTVGAIKAQQFRAVERLRDIMAGELGE